MGSFNQATECLFITFSKSFAYFWQVGTNLPAYLDQRHGGVQAIQPSVLVLGTRLEPSQSFFIVDGLAIQATSLLKAVDICFKAFYVLDVCYPKKCHTTWEFFQKFFFFKWERGKESL
ncbi:hypothetical protein HOLleu_05308 [Holothuria leucospilota]|uniref:Uncharacterized protein n=1 Tax=Holothuria leucospilota TaxID=206669 RepID=A0A9Q1HEF8_HOLLE|nr:hypothetical protein HOLleu_05308 [Holothuria leucospilota]